MFGAMKVFGRCSVWNTKPRKRTKGCLEHETAKADETAKRENREICSELFSASVTGALITDRGAAPLTGHFRAFVFRGFRSLSWFRVPKTSASRFRGFVLQHLGARFNNLDNCANWEYIALNRMDLPKGGE